MKLSDTTLTVDFSISQWEGKSSLIVSIFPGNFLWLWLFARGPFVDVASVYVSEIWLFLEHFIASRTLFAMFPRVGTLFNTFPSSRRISCLL